MLINPFALPFFEAWVLFTTNQIKDDFIAVVEEEEEFEVLSTKIW